LAIYNVFLMKEALEVNCR